MATPLPIDPTVPDPFGRAGYRGTLVREADRAKEVELLGAGGFETGFRVFASPDVAYYRFPNGYGAGVLQLRGNSGFGTSTLRQDQVSGSFARPRGTRLIFLPSMRVPPPAMVMKIVPVDLS